MKSMVYITGGSEGVGKDIFDHYSPQAKSFSRRTGYDIGKDEDRRRIVEESLECDIFVNFAHNGHYTGQPQLLYDIFALWEEKEKSGYIVNMGTYSTFSSSPKFRRYAVVKKALDIANQQCCKKIENGLVPFRMTNLRPGMLDTEKSRQKDHWEGVGVTGESICKTIDWLVSTPKDLLIPEMVLSPIVFDH